MRKPRVAQDGGRLVVASDLHFVKPRLESVPFSILAQIEAICGNVEASGIILAGDLYDTRGKLSVILQNRVIQALFDLTTRTRLNIYSVIGNHDLATREGGLHDSSLFPVHAAIGAFVIQEPQVVPKARAILYGFNYDPEVHDLNRVVAEFELLDNPVYDGYAHIGVFHQVTSGSESATGWVFGEGLDADLLATKFNFSIVGDVHQPQLVNERVLVPGAPYRMDHGDQGERGCWVLSIGPDGEVTPDFRPLESPEFLTLEATSAKEVKAGLAEAQARPQDFIRLRFPKALAKLARQAQWPSNVTPMEIPETASEVRVELGDSAQEVVRRYVKFVGESPEVDTDEAIRVGLALLEGEDAPSL